MDTALPSAPGTTHGGIRSTKPHRACFAGKIPCDKSHIRDETWHHRVNRCKWQNRVYQAINQGKALI